MTFADASRKGSHPGAALIAHVQTNPDSQSRRDCLSDHQDRAPAFLQEVAPLVMSGRIKFREDIVDGLDKAPEAFIGLLHGKNFGKLMVRVSPDPTR